MNKALVAHRVGATILVSTIAWVGCWPSGPPIPKPVPIAGFVLCIQGVCLCADEDSLTCGGPTEETTFCSKCKTCPAKSGDPCITCPGDQVLCGGECIDPSVPKCGTPCTKCPADVSYCYHPSNVDDSHGN